MLGGDNLMGHLFVSRRSLMSKECLLGFPELPAFLFFFSSPAAENLFPVIIKILLLPFVTNERKAWCTVCGVYVCENEAWVPSNTLGFYEWFTSGAKVHKWNVGEADASSLEGTVPAHTDGELKTARSHKSTKSIFVPLDLHSEHPYNTQTNVGRWVPQETLYVE